MSNLGTLYAKIEADTGGLRQAEKAVKGFSMRSAASIGLIAAAAAGATAAMVGIAKFKGFLQDSIKLAGVQEQAEAKLGAVIKATGGAAGFSAGELKKYAGELQDITIYGDETTISAMAVLATFKKIKGDEFKAATRAAQDMSAVMGTSLESSILQIGKALNDPISGLTALNRAGVTFTEQQKNQITALQESGDMMKAQKLILAELQSQFSGASEEMRGTFGGALEAVKGRYADLKEEVGFAITKNEFFLEGLKLLEQQMISWTGYIQENGDEIREYAKQGALVFLTFGENALTAMDYVYRASQGIGGVFQRTSALALDLSGGIFKIVQAGAALTDWLGITDNEFERWGTEAKAAFDAAEYLKQRAGENFKQMQEGAPRIQAAKEALAGFREELEKIPPRAVDISDEAKRTKKDTNEITTATEGYTAELELVNGTWQKQAKEIQAVESEIDKIIRKLDGLDGTAATITVTDGRAGGGAIGRKLGGAIGWARAQTGRYFPGYGGGDKIRILGEAGEYMLRKEAVREGGYEAAKAFNEGNWPKLMEIVSQKLSLGGPAQAAWPSLALAGGGSVGNAQNTGSSARTEFPRNYYVPGDSEPIRIKADERNAQRLMSALERRNRRRI